MQNNDHSDWVRWALDDEPADELPMDETPTFTETVSFEGWERFEWDDDGAVIIC
jgi:hypothetical protein